MTKRFAGRTVATVKRLYDDRKLIIAKGLASKVLDTSSGGQDSGKLQWKCEEREGEFALLIFFGLWFWDVEGERVRVSNVFFF